MTFFANKGSIFCLKYLLNSNFCYNFAAYLYNVLYKKQLNLYN